MLSPGGSMSGGAFKNSSNLLGRRREIEELETSVAGNEKKLKSLETELSNARDKLSVVRNELEQLKTELQEKQLAENTSSMNLEAAERKQEELNRAYTNSKRESEEIEVSVLQINAEIDACKIALAESERHDKELTDKINSDNTKIEQNKIGRASCRERV